MIETNAKSRSHYQNPRRSHSCNSAEFIYRTITEISVITSIL
ncbi:hypothetical protein NIES2104_42060 [Leptolyngbya sp. NIES-2104]|nr:hypothetical protein NIES2104_42060 [Leptolyngbya sp. NIES-2104]